MVTNQAEHHRLRAVHFLPGHYSDLFTGKFLYGQLEAIGEILDLSNSYVLNDSLAVTGFPFKNSRNAFSQFIESELSASDSIESIGSGTWYQYDVTPIDESLGLPEYEQRLKLMDGKLDHYRMSLARPENPEPEEREEIRRREEEYNQVADEARILQQQSYIMLADRLEATYVPERLYGSRALASYHHVLDLSQRRAPHSVESGFRTRLVHQLDSLQQSSDDFGVHVPSFFVEALCQAETQEGIWHSLRDIRISKAAESYRSLVRVVTDEAKPLKERLEAQQELERNSEDAFSGDTLKSRIPRWFKFTVGLSPIAIGALLPPYGLAAGAAPIILEMVDEVDTWLRRRANIFDLYREFVTVDMYSELKRLFPNIQFQPGHLSHFLQNRDFGWTESG